MPDSPKVQELLDEILASEATPEEVCRSCPDLLPQIHARWRQISRVRLELDAMFPPEKVRPHRDNGVLPRIVGYEVQAVLGQGGAGVVFRARDLRLGRPVAIKMLLAGVYAGPTELTRFQLEAEAVAGLCHANIVQLYETGDHEGRPYFTMEFVDGGSLAQKLAGTPPANAGGSLTNAGGSLANAGGSQPIRWAAELVASLTEAVSVAHRAGIIHRDLKPGNILLTAEGLPKISDFGLARRLKGEGALTWTGTAVGTPSYMAPEQASDAAGPIGPATDVYGLGAVLYELLTGRPPFRATTALETFRLVLSQEPVPPSRLNPKVPRDLETVCLKCLHKDPQRRYTSAAALAEDLQRFLQGQVVAARPVSPFERTVKWIRRNRWVAGLSAAVVVALVTGTVASLLFGFEASRQEGLAKSLSGEREQQILELEAKNREVEAQKREVEERQRESDRIAVAGFLTTIGRNSQPMYGNMFDIADAGSGVRLCSTRRGAEPR